MKFSSHLVENGKIKYSSSASVSNIRVHLSAGLVIGSRRSVKELLGNNVQGGEREQNNERLRVADAGAVGRECTGRGLHTLVEFAVVQPGYGTVVVERAEAFAGLGVVADRVRSVVPAKRENGKIMVKNSITSNRISGSGKEKELFYFIIERHFFAN
jgi:hypothetical protein